jgi:tRNA pseudouridine55 synthase
VGAPEKRAPRPKIPWRRVDGVLLLDKPTGMSSNDALQKARRLFLAEKGGHTGTLDPMASGLLPLCFGEATKFAHDLLDADKTYEATVRFGQRTDTGDADGTIVDERPVACTTAEVEAALERFRGEIDQVPPMYSALKKDGVPLYKLARQGHEVERQARRVTIHALDWLRVDLEATAPSAVLRVRCSKGTYVRTLAEDIGEVLGCGAHLTALRRTQVGRLDLAGAPTLDALREAAAACSDGAVPAAALRPVDDLVAELPMVLLEPGLAATARFLNGNAIEAALPDGDRFRVYVAESFAGVAVRDARNRLQPQRLLALRV